MNYEGNIIRPPSEANSILLQVAVGCSHNKCTFCGTYTGERFRIKPDSAVMDDIAFAAEYCKRQRRLFLIGGDALIIPQKRLVNVLSEIKKQLPWVTRVGLYGNTKSLDMKSLEELKELKELGIGIVYMGLESGDDVTLKNIRKGANSDRMIEMGRKAKAAGFKLSVTVLLGIAGRNRSKIHAVETGRVLTAIDPDYIGALTLMLIPDTAIFKAHEAGEFDLLSPIEMLKEIRNMFSKTNLTRGQFHANHASNYLPIRARLPKDKEAVLNQIDEALAGKINLRPEHLRGL